MKKIIGQIWLWFSGWKSDYRQELRVDKSVMIAAPHTSNWDLIYALAVFWKFKIPVRFFIKDSMTKGLHGWFFKMLGAIGVDRSKKGNLVDYAAQVIQERDKIVLLVPAEGTRSRVEKWKTGFYHIAKKADVPVLLGYLDYKKKIAGVGDKVDLTENYQKDMQKIQNFYAKIPAKHPEKYNPNIY